MEHGDDVVFAAASAPAPPVGAPAAVEDGAAPAPIGADPRPSPPPPPASAAAEVVPAAMVDGEARMVVPAAAAAAAADWWYKDHVNVCLFVLAMMILAFVLVYDMGVHPTSWWGKLAAMTGAQWRAAFFLAVGDIVSLGLIFSQTGYFRRLWRRECGAGLAAVVPLLAGAVNCGVWLAYGVVVEGRNISVIVINCTGVAFNIVYTLIFYHRSGTRRDHTMAVISLAAAVAIVIAAIDFVVIDGFGWEAPTAVGGSGAITAMILYAFRAYVTMGAAHHNRAAGGFSAVTLTSFANALVWFVYACVQGDVSMQVSNAVGMACFLLHAAQLVYFRLTPSPEEETRDVRQRLLEQEP